MPPKAKSLAPSTTPRDAGVSGKWIIIGVFTVALIGAGTSWWFRYYSTHRIAQFWGPKTAQLIRDASTVETIEPRRNISSAKGLVHLRNALLEDRSFDWPMKQISDDVRWQNGLAFQSSADPENAVISFSSDFRWVRLRDAETMLSCAPISAGLREMFAEFEELPTITPSSPATEAAPPNAAPK